MKAIVKFVFGVLGKLVLFITVPFANIIVPFFYRAKSYDADKYTWGGIWGTFDNPPQGDRGWVTKHSIFPNIVTGWKGYVNRVGWMFRNPLYGYSKLIGVDYKEGYELMIHGNPDISDKYKISGWMFATLRDTRGNLIAFEWYSVTPYSKTRNVRIRLGWKIKTEKMQERGWARHVVTINPFDGYGKREDR